jgi:Cu(I)/Ag(I) efflux system membrane protein CusA/SilA
MVGGVVTSGIMELLVYPVIFYLWRGRRLDPSPTATSEHSVHEDGHINPPQIEGTFKESTL